MKKYLNKYLLLIILFIFCGLGADARDVIRILTIGNSFSEDAVENYLYDLAKAAGDSLVIGNLYIGGCSLETHSANAASNAANYSYRKIVGGKKTVTPGQTLSYGIKDEPWDYISFQQASPYSGLAQSYFPHLPNLMDYVAAHALNPKVKYIFHRTWAYAKNSPHKGFANYQNDQDQMFKAIVKATNEVTEKVQRLKILIPAGTAIQNARTSVIGDSLTRDGYHLQLTYGRYTAACTWLEALTGKSPVGNTYIPETITREQANIAQHAAHYAIRRPDKVTSLAKAKL
ncbi:uncharacterized protein DUF4886 [Arcticibacter pallidicorallinus]|uniref:Uncharacterized protein DUF4886 n=1 Tax=Arcticibacter pallidicorallinus TaxID=1259464 RepID=A0A2T0U929_9SPHI|nr:DUF4886 domain-containing protein [Arcticibacter pallidicorallinus]PRY54433.1 uncharacterized protein DUF4886 [Arcticibacter pallidicorallinus]